MRFSAIAIAVHGFWLDPTIQKGIEYRNSDIMISVPAKSGTTWTMNIVHQLRTGGDPDVEDLYGVVPWSEFREYPNQSAEELYTRWKALPAEPPRAFKTHSAPGPMMDFHDKMKYVVVARSPLEAVGSIKPFMQGHDPALFKLWEAEWIEEAFMGHKTLQSLYEKFVLKGEPIMPPGAAPPGGFLTIWFYSFITGWWPLREKPNVLMLHYNEMKSDHEGSIRKIADFLGFKPTAEQWPKILEYTSFKWMKANGRKFELPTCLCKNNPTHPSPLLKLNPDGSCPVSVIKPGGMVRKGMTGKAAEDGVTPELEKDILEWAEKMVPNAAARKWLFEGGAIPPIAKDEL
jgi:hypothetical protein